MRVYKLLKVEILSVCYCRCELSLIDFILGTKKSLLNFENHIVNNESVLLDFHSKHCCLRFDLCKVAICMVSSLRTSTRFSGEKMLMLKNHDAIL